MPEVIDDPHFWERGTLQPMRSSAFDDPVPGIASGFPVNFSGGRLPQSQGAPLLGGHNGEVYRDVLELSNDDLIEYQEEGIV